MIKQIQYFLKMDWLLFLSALFLSFWGLSVLYSIALGQGAITQGDLWSSVLVRKQVIALIISVILFFVASFSSYKLFFIYSRYFIFGIFIVLIGVLVFGSDMRGTKGWIALGGFNFQPVELAKLIIIISLAKYFTNHAKYLKQFRQLIISGILTLIFILLVLAQPDFGSAMILLSIWIGMMFSIGVPKKYLAMLGVVFVILAILGWFFALKDYQKNRIEVFINPQSDALGSGYNVTQAIIAIGSGQLFGKGLAFGSQSQLKFLPESHTDFIFAVIAEEMGFVSVVLFLFLFMFIFYRLIRIGKSSADDFGYLVCVGITISIFAQMFINIAMNMGLAPVTGLPLPFVSFGGSSLIMTFIMLGIAQNIYIKARI
jgi:rod shape determining protein RodA